MAEMIQSTIFWQDYVAIRDRLNWLEHLDANTENTDKATLDLIDKEYSVYKRKLDDLLVDVEDCESLSYNYEYGLAERYHPNPKENCKCTHGWTKYGPCQCRLKN